jgi:hypothetical protein
MSPASGAAKAIAETILSPAPSIEDEADALLAGHEGDPRAAVVALLRAVRALKDENRVLRGVASPGFARRRPFVFGPSP